MRIDTNKKQAWNAMWALDLTTLDDFYAEGVTISGFSPPKQTTWKGIEALRAVRKTSHLQSIYLDLNVLTKILVTALQGTPASRHLYRFQGHQSR